MTASKKRKQGETGAEGGGGLGDIIPENTHEHGGDDDWLSRKEKFDRWLVANDISIGELGMGFDLKGYVEWASRNKNLRIYPNASNLLEWMGLYFRGPESGRIISDVVCDLFFVELYLKGELPKIHTAESFISFMLIQNERLRAKGLPGVKLSDVGRAVAFASGILSDDSKAIPLPKGKCKGGIPEAAQSIGGKEAAVDAVITEGQKQRFIPNWGKMTKEWVFRESGLKQTDDGFEAALYLLYQKETGEKWIDIESNWTDRQFIMFAEQAARLALRRRSDERLREARERLYRRGFYRRGITIGCEPSDTQTGAGVAAGLVRQGTQESTGTKSKSVADGGGGRNAGDANVPEVTDGFFSISELIRRNKIPDYRQVAFRRQMGRWRKKNLGSNDFHEHDAPCKQEASYLFREKAGSIQDIIKKYLK